LGSKVYYAIEVPNGNELHRPIGADKEFTHFHRDLKKFLIESEL